MRIWELLRDDKSEVLGRAIEKYLVALNSPPSIITRPITPVWVQLPAELWHSVFGYLAQKEHLLITLVCRRLRSIVEPHLYSQFIWVLPEKWVPTPILPNARDIRKLVKSRRKKRCEYPRDTFSRLPPPYLLLQTLLKRPELAHCFKQVRISASAFVSGIFWSDLEARECGLSPKQLEDLTGSIKSMSHLSQKEWLDGIYQGRLDVITELLLTRLSRLVDIDICLHDNPTVGSTVFELLKTKPLPQTLPVFPDLRSISVSMNTAMCESFSWKMVHELVDEYSVGAQLPTLLQIPQIESLSLDYLEFYSLRFEDPLPIAANLKKLHLKYGFMGDPELHHILKATPLLSELEADLCFDRSQYPDGDWLECDLLSEALSEIKSTLTSLHLTINIQEYNHNWDGLGRWNVTGSLTSLPGFQKLEKLALPIILLLGNVDLDVWKDHRGGQEGEDEARDARWDLEILLPGNLKSFENTGLDWATARVPNREAEFALVKYLVKKGWWKR